LSCYFTSFKNMWTVCCQWKYSGLVILSRVVQGPRWSQRRLCPPKNFKIICWLIVLSSSLPPNQKSWIYPWSSHRSIHQPTHTPILPSIHLSIPTIHLSMIITLFFFKHIYWIAYSLGHEMLSQFKPYLDQSIITKA